MNASQRDPRVLFTVLWIFIVLNFFARDIHELGRPGMLEQMMSGVVGGIEITEALMLLGGVMIEIPTFMSVLALALPRRVNRWTNAGASLLTTAMIIAAKLTSEFKDKTTAINQLWQTDFTYLKIIGWINRDFHLQTRQRSKGYEISIVTSGGLSDRRCGPSMHWFCLKRQARNLLTRKLFSS